VSIRMTLEHIRYTWAKAGILGHGMYQPIAASNGLLDTSTRIYARATRLCRYDRPPQESDERISFGWIDSDNLRYAFRRVFLPDLQRGHPGNFAAHVIVGPPERLSVRRLLRTWDTDLWWSGPEDDDTVGELPTITTLPSNDSLAPARGPSAVTLLATLLEAPGRVVLPNGSSDALIAGLLAIDESVPLMLEQRSFSMWEGDRQAEWFDLVVSGASVKGKPLAPSIVAQRAAEYCLTDRYSGRRASALLGHDTRSFQARRDMARTCAFLRTLATGDDAESEPVLLAALRGSAEVILSDPRATSYLASRLIAGDKAICQGVSVAARTQLSFATLCRLGRAIGQDHTFAYSSAPLAALANELSDYVVDGIITGAFETGRSPDPIAELPDEYLQGLLRSDAPELEARANIIRSESLRRGSLRWVFDERIQPRFRSELFVGFASRSERLSEFEALRTAGPLADLASRSPDQYWRLARSWKPEFGISLLLDSCGDRLDQGQAQVLEDLLRASPRLATGFLPRILELAPTEPAWSALVDTIVRIQISRYLHDETVPYPPHLDGIVESQPGVGIGKSVQGFLSNPTRLPVSRSDRDPLDSHGLDLLYRLAIDAAVNAPPAVSQDVTANTRPRSPFNTALVERCLERHALTMAQLASALSVAALRAARASRHGAAEDSLRYLASRIAALNGSSRATLFDELSLALLFGRAIGAVFGERDGRAIIDTLRLPRRTEKDLHHIVREPTQPQRPSQYWWKR
jgi:hypothetical protein